MEEFQVKDKSLASQGHLQIEWAEKHMPVLNIIKKRFEKEKPLKGQTLAACLHVTKETAVLIKVLIAGGANVVVLTHFQPKMM
jgi:adenosylhomocysteinase